MINNKKESFNNYLRRRVRAKIVAAGILPAVEPWLPARRKDARTGLRPEFHLRQTALRQIRILPPSSLACFVVRRVLVFSKL
jgi:hypothetical protein